MYERDEASRRIGRRDVIPPLQPFDQNTKVYTGGNTSKVKEEPDEGWGQKGST